LRQVYCILDSGHHRSKSDHDEIQDVIIIGGKDEDRRDKNKKENRFRIVPVRESRKEDNDEEGILMYDRFSILVFTSDVLVVIRFFWHRNIFDVL